jgi:hypothetical protein
MNKLILATGSDNNYLHRIQPYLASIVVNSNFDHNVLAFLSDDTYDSGTDKITVSNISPSMIRAKNIYSCMQHGEFLHGDFFAGLNDNDVIFFTDGDITLQRPLTEDEDQEFRNLKDGDVYIGYNASPTDTLYDESTRISQINITPYELIADWNNIKIYNSGVVAMNKKTWLRLIEDYVNLYPAADFTFAHVAKQQWLISFIIGTKKDYNIIEIPYHIHAHRHYGVPEGTYLDENGKAVYKNTVILFRHAF